MMTAKLRISNIPRARRFQTSLRAPAKQSISPHEERMDCFVALLLAMTPTHTFAISPRHSREFCFERPALRTSEGAGNAGRAMRPQPCVRNKKAHKRSHHGHTGNTRHSPRNGFNGL
jgi:hypothetical protein